jgi:enamine deaminase RidA (YjgF/YER057c/UK114 family)
MSARDRLSELGIELPAAPPAKGAYVPTLEVAQLLFVSGTLPLVDDAIAVTGAVGAEVSVEDAQAAARQCIINMLARLEADLGSLARIGRWVKLTGFVASAPGFVAQPTVMNSASELLVDVFGQAGRHTRSAVGVTSLPLGAPVEIEAIIALGS